MYFAFCLTMFSVVFVACTQEAPTLSCKKMDQNGVCLDGAQTSAPATAATPQPSGMTPEQMRLLLAALQTQQNNRLDTYTPNQTLQQVYDTEESWLVAEIQNLQDKKTNTTSQTELNKLDATIRQHQDRLNQIREDKNSSGWKDIKDYGLEYAQKNPNQVVAGLKWLGSQVIAGVNYLRHRGGNKEGCDPLVSDC